MPVRAEPRRSLLPPVLALGLLGLILRVLYVVSISTRSSGLGDADEFHGLANVLADGRGFVDPFGAGGMATAHKPPLYPLLLAAVSLAGGRSYEAHQLATAVLGAGTVVAVGYLAHRIAGRRAALIAAGLAAIYPAFLTTDASLHAETLYALLVALVLLAAAAALERPTGPRFAVLGAAAALAALTRSEGILLLLIVLPLALRAGVRKRGRRIAIAVLACGAVLAPWLIRCWIVFDQPVAITTSSGDLLAGANCASTYRGSLIGEWAFGCVLGAHGANEAQVADRLRARGLRFAEHHKRRLPRVILARALRPWGLYRPGQEIDLQATAGAGPRWAGWVGLITAWACLVLAVVGAALLHRRGGRTWRLLLAPVLLVVVVSVTGYGILRFRAPADVSLVVLAAVALAGVRPGRATEARAR